MPSLWLSRRVVGGGGGKRLGDMSCTVPTLVAVVQLSSQKDSPSYQVESFRFRVPRAAEMEGQMGYRKRPAFHV